MEKTNKNMEFIKALLTRTANADFKLANILAQKVVSLSTDDPTAGYQIASIAVFLAGLDKLTSLAFELLAISGELPIKNLRPKQEQPGVLSCGVGLTKKLNKLYEIGVIKTDLTSLVETRNDYFHSQNLLMGFESHLEEEKIVIAPRLLTATTSGTPMVQIDDKWLQDTATRTTNELVDYFCNNKNLKKRLKSLFAYIDTLPSRVEVKTDSKNYPVETQVEQLNAQHIGQQWQICFEKISEERQIDRRDK